MEVEKSVSLQRDSLPVYIIKRNMKNSIRITIVLLFFSTNGFCQTTSLDQLIANYYKVKIELERMNPADTPELCVEKAMQFIKLYKNINEIDSTMDGYDFEKYSAVLLEKNGFKNVQVTQCSGDFGVDIIAFKDDIKYAIQCKKYSSPVGVKAVQEVIASKAMNDCHVAVVLTNNSFTNSAKQLAKKNNVLLWDNTKLNELIDNAKIKE